MHVQDKKYMNNRKTWFSVYYGCVATATRNLKDFRNFSLKTRIVLLGTNRSKPELNVQKGTGVQIRTPHQEPKR